MGQKLEDGTLKDSCLDKLLPGEPFFVLRGRDFNSPLAVRKWAAMAFSNGASPEKLEEAEQTAKSMEEWQQEHGGKWAD